MSWALPAPALHRASRRYSRRGAATGMRGNIAPNRRLAKPAMARSIDGHPDHLRRVPSVCPARMVPAAKTREAGMPTKIDGTLGPRYSPTHIRATWDGTGSVEDASKALGFSRAKGYDLIRSGQFPCRVLRIGRKTRVITASLLRVLESGDPECNDARIGRHPTP
ncbi:helix-turn-helix domain-containing protein [Streptomyces albogriseolus]|uniref:helix-turn-helix domain-containing protein n=1 Tax=Streptomyces albogriseolus TaxID=1887 RepID=UPI003460830B